MALSSRTKVFVYGLLLLALSRFLVRSPRRSGTDRAHPLLLHSARRSPSAGFPRHAFGRSNERVEARSEGVRLPAVNVSMLPSFRCTQEAVRKQAEWWVESEAKWNSSDLNCAGFPPLDRLLASNKPRFQGPITVLAIGTNQGYELVKWLDLCAPSSQINSQTWSFFLRSVYFHLFHELQLCGPCMECIQAPFQTSHSDSAQKIWFDLLPSFSDGYNLPNNNDLRIIGIEPSKLDFRILEILKEWSKHQSLQVHQFAVANFTKNSQSSFQTFNKKLKMSSLSKSVTSSPKYLTHFVKIFTLDDVFIKLEISHIHLLKISMSGHDPSILEGASRALALGKISVIQFEFVNLGPWLQTSLQSVVHFMDNLNFDCYLNTPAGIPLRLTRCFHECFQSAFGANVVCAHRSQAWLTGFLLQNSLLRRQ